MNGSNRNSRFPFEDRSSKKSKFDEFSDMINDHEEMDSLMGYLPSEFDEGLALNTHEDSYHPQDISHIHTDDEIEKVIKELFRNTKKIDTGDISIQVSKGQVKLSGSVKSQFDRDYAITLVKLVHGVGGVKSELIVKMNQGILPTDIGRNPG